MNHLAGLPIPPPASLGDAAEDALAEFRAAIDALEGAEAGGKPSFAASSAALPESGWRPLDDWTLLRFLRADVRKGKVNLEASVARLTAALAWRRELALDDVLAHPPPAVERYEALRVRRWTGRAHDGRPVQFERLGQFLGSGNGGAFTEDEWVHFYAHDIEVTFVEMRAAAEALGRDVTTYVFCGDLGGLLSLGAVRRVMGAVPLITALAKRVESHYPEIAGPIILFNTGAVIAKAFQWVRPMLDPVTMEKVELHAGVPTERFLELMPAAVLPECYGGANAATSYPETGRA